MKHFTRFFLIAFVMASSLASAQPARFRTKLQSKPETSGKLFNFFQKAIEESGTWKPKKLVLYGADPEAGEGSWYKESEQTIEYNQRGNEISITETNDDDQIRTLTQFDAFNNKIEEIDQTMENGQWVNDSRSEYAYDNVVKDYQTEKKDYKWDPVSNQWNLTYAHQIVITRNAKGHVTRQSVMLINTDGQYDEIERTEITYTDGDLPATSWKFLQADETLQLHEMIRYDKINWDRSDGQILTREEAFVMGNNRIKKADIYDEGVKTATFSCTYTDGKTDFNSQLKSANSNEEILQKLTELDQNGSYREEIISKVDESGDGQLTEHVEFMVITFDEHKNVTSEEYYGVNDGGLAELVGGGKYLYTYGPNGEAAEAILQMYDFDLEKYSDIIKLVCSDFVFFASEINNIQTGEPNLNVHCSGNLLNFEMEGMNQYSLYSATGTLVSGGQVTNNQGAVELSGLPSGLYFIKATGSKQSQTAKFIKK